MIRTIVSAVITLLLILGVSIYDIHYVQKTFEVFHGSLRTLKEKTQLGEATYSDGLPSAPTGIRKKRRCTFGYRTPPLRKLITSWTRQSGICI